MQEPCAFVVGIEGDRDWCPNWYDESVADCARETASANSDDLEMMAVQMHRMHHRGWVFKRHLDAFALVHIKGCVLTMNLTIDRPAIAGPLAQHNHKRFVRPFRRQRFHGP